MVTEARTGAAAPDDTAEHRHRFSVLIADDDRGNREALGEVLDRQGFRTVLAEDGGKAVELVQVDLVHLVLFDMHMPGLTGLEAFAVIRQTLDRVLPAVLMTADANNDLIRRAFQAQVFSVIPKPVNTNIVLNTLSRALAKVYGATPPAATAPDKPARNEVIHPGDRAMKIVPLNDKILVERLEADDKTAGGIILPDTAKEKPKQGKILAVGEGKPLENGKRATFQVKVGDRVLFSSYSGNEINHEGKEYLIMTEDEILAVVD